MIGEVLRISELFLGTYMYDFHRLHSIAFQARKLSDDYTFMVVLWRIYEFFQLQMDFSFFCGELNHFFLFQIKRIAFLLLLQLGIVT